MNERERGTADRDSVVAEECQAFLDGIVAEYWEQKGVDVPVWAWMNLLAHGTLEQIVVCVARQGRIRRSSRKWAVARSYAAAEVLDRVDDEFTLYDLQATVLVPLELEMSARAEVNRWTPRQWVDMVDFAIRNTYLTLEL